MPGRAEEKRGDGGSRGQVGGSARARGGVPAGCGELARTSMLLSTVNGMRGSTLHWQRRPHSVRGRRRRFTPVVAVALVATVAGCASPGDTQPTPSGTPPSSPSPSTPFEENVTDEAAFAAAEATYRGYVDALNDVNLADPSTFESVYAWLDGQALEEETRSLREMSAKAFTVKGQTVVREFTVPIVEPSIVAVACLDVSDVDLRDHRGESQVPPSRPDVYELRLEFSMSSTTPTGLAIQSSHAIREQRCS